MASFNTHLAIAKLYAKRNKIKDLNAFYIGSIDPDLTEDKDTTHYGFTPDSFEHAWIRVASKVDLKKFLENNPLDNDLNLGRFLHLVTDQKYFNEFYGKDFLIKLDHDKFMADNFYSYHIINPYLIEKYSLSDMKVQEIMDYDYMQKKIQFAWNKINSAKDRFDYSPKCIIDTDKLDKFIKEVASLDLQSTAKLARNS